MTQRGIYYLQRKNGAYWDTLQEAEDATDLREQLAEELAAAAEAQIRIVAGHPNQAGTRWVYEQVFYLDPNTIDLGFANPPEPAALEEPEPSIPTTWQMEPEQETDLELPDLEIDDAPQDHGAQQTFQERLAALEESTTRSLAAQPEPEPERRFDIDSDTQPFFREEPDLETTGDFSSRAGRGVPEEDTPSFMHQGELAPRRKRSVIGFLLVFLLATLLVAAAGLGVLVYQKHPLVMHWSDTIGVTKVIKMIPGLGGGHEGPDAPMHKEEMSDQAPDKTMQPNQESQSSMASTDGQGEQKSAETPMTPDKVMPLTTGEVLVFNGVAAKLRGRWSGGACETQFVEFTAKGYKVTADGATSAEVPILETLEDDYQYYLRLSPDRLSHFQKLGPNDLQPAGTTTKGGLQGQPGSVRILSRCR